MQTLYKPDSPRINSEGRFHTTRLMFRELITAREIVFILFVRDFKARYRQSILGFVWAFFLPVITVFVFMLMNRSGIVTIQEVGTPYPIYALIGLSIWQLFSAGAVASANSLIAAGSMITKINFPKVALVLAASAQGIVEFLIRLLLIIVAFFYYDIMPELTGIGMGILTLLPLYLLMLGIGLILSVLAAIVRDVINVLNIGLTSIMLLSPILYPITGSSLLARINNWNPFHYLISVPRDFILRSETNYFDEFILVSLISVIVFYIGWRLFYIAQPIVAERI